MTKKCSIKGVLFDIGGVLLDFDHMKSCEKLAPVCGLPPAVVYERLFDSGLEREFDLGLPPASFYNRALKLLDITSKKISYGEFAGVWGGIFKERPEVTSIVKGLNGRCRLFILSNTNTMHYSYISKNFAYFNTCFEASFLSFELKQRKPDHAVFAAVLKQTGLPPSSILYIDDLPEHVRAANKSGLNAVLYTSAKELANTLKSVGL